MRPYCSFVLLGLAGLLAGCASATHIVATDDDTIMAVSATARDLVSADVVALGELHQTPDVHEAHHQLVREMFRLRPNMVIAMEMFERDVQNVLLQYLTGDIDEFVFRRDARPWPHYDRDYRPIVEFAKENGIMVLAANAPRPLAQKAAREGIANVLGDAHVARETTAPKDGYWDAFVEAMEGHAGMFGEGGMERFYAAQCLKDDTMAESVTDYLQRRYAVGDRPLAVLICGRMHSDYGRGTVQRMKNRMPNLDVRVVSATTVADVAAAFYDAPSGLADYVVVAPEVERAAPPPVLAQAPVKPEPAAAGEPVDELPTANPEGMRPGFGFMPGDYNGEVIGVLVGPVSPGGSAEAAGIEEGDVIVAIRGIPVPDIDSYVEVLNTLIIGRTVTVRVRREEAEVDLQVVVGSRSR